MENRYDKGLEHFLKLTGEQGHELLDNLNAVAPDFARYIVEFPFGDIASRPGIDIKTRELVIIGMLAAMGKCAPTLKIHLQAALGIGCTKEEIIEVLMQTAVYAGFPAAVNALALAKEVFA